MKETEVIEIQGMHCQGCADKVKTELEKNGLEHVFVDFVTEKASFINTPNLPLQNIAPLITKLGYKPIINETKKNWFDEVEHMFLATLPFSVVLLSHMFIDLPLLHHPWFQLILCLPVLFAGIYTYGISAYKSIIQLSPNMNVLIMLGAFASFIYSLIGMFVYDGNHHYIFFETTANIISFVLLGSYIEKKAVAKTSKNLDLLRSNIPITAFKIIHDLLTNQETTIEIDIRHVKKGDVLIIHKGGQIPADGIITHGEALLDESLMTGESPGIKKVIGEKTIGGSYVLEGWIKIVATNDFENSTLNTIVREVEKARGQKPAIQLLADTISFWFVPGVIIISIITFIVNFWVLNLDTGESMMRAVAVLVISCPCALGLATPLAVVVGLGKAAREGIIVKSGSDLETLSKVKTVIFDKTGTLTSGKLKVTDFITFNFSERDAKNTIHFFETHSSHPIALSILSEYSHWYHHNISFTEITEVSGQGIFAKDQFTNRYTLGSLSLCLNTVLEPTPGYDIYLTLNDKIIAAFNLEEEIKVGAKEMVQHLHDKGYQTVILSGDSNNKCFQTAEKLGIKRVFARCLPTQKAEIVEHLSNESITTMVGDGINDTIAMAKSHIGIAVGGASDLTREHANVVLLKNDPIKIETAITIGLDTYQTIKQNLWWALAYNIIAIPMASAGYLSPLVAAWGMAFSDLVLIANTILKLGRRK